jgi:thioredoxin-like negative regulator of GroEL
MLDCGQYRLAGDCVPELPMGTGGAVAGVSGVCGVGILCVERTKMKLYRVNDVNFKRFIELETPVKVLLFETRQCLYCKVMRTVLDEIGDEYAGRVSFGRIDALSSTLGGQLGISAVPLLAAYISETHLVDTMLGAKGLPAVKQWIDEVLKKVK